jgi:hypothetical protein
MLPADTILRSRYKIIKLLVQEFVDGHDLSTELTPGKQGDLTMKGHNVK